MTQSEYKGLVARAKKFGALSNEIRVLEEILNMADRVTHKYGNSNTCKFTISGSHGNGNDHIEVTYSIEEETYSEIRALLGSRYNSAIKKIDNLK